MERVFIHLFFFRWKFWSDGANCLHKGEVFCLPIVLDSFPGHIYPSKRGIVILGKELSTHIHIDDAKLLHGSYGNCIVHSNE